MIDDPRTAQALIVQCRVLIVKWRRIEAQHREVGDAAGRGAAYAHQYCADELEAAVAALGDPPGGAWQIPEDLRVKLFAFLDAEMDCGGNPRGWALAAELRMRVKLPAAPVPDAK